MGDIKTGLYTSGEYYRKNLSFHVEDSAWKAKQILKMIHTHRLDPETVCEVGCGAGEICYQLYRHLPGNTHIYGYEISPPAYEQCSSRVQDRLKFFNLDLLSEKSNQSFDLLLVIDVFEHVEDYLGFLRQLRGKGKQFIFHIPLDMNVQMVFRSQRLLYLRDQVGHLHYFSKDTALVTLKDTGYQVRDYFYTSSINDLSKSLRHRFASIPRKIAFRVQPDLAVRILGGYSLMVFAD